MWRKAIGISIGDRSGSNHTDVTLTHYCHTRTHSTQSTQHNGAQRWGHRVCTGSQANIAIGADDLCACAHGNCSICLNVYCLDRADFSSKGRNDIGHVLTGHCHVCIGIRAQYHRVACAYYCTNRCKVDGARSVYGCVYGTYRCCTDDRRVHRRSNDSCSCAGSNQYSRRVATVYRCGVASTHKTNLTRQHADDVGHRLTACRGMRERNTSDSNGINRARNCNNITEVYSAKRRCIHVVGHVDNGGAQRHRGGNDGSASIGGHVEGGATHHCSSVTCGLSPRRTAICKYHIVCSQQAHATVGRRNLGTNAHIGS